MVEEIRAWPDRLMAGRDLAHNFYFEHSARLPKSLKRIAFFGMGGSGIAGRIMQTFFDRSSPVQTYVGDGPQLPVHIDTDTLAVVVSYSGNTWEAVDAFTTLINRHIPTLVIAHGGALIERAEERNSPFILVPKSKAPRSALGYFLGIMLGLFDQISVLKGQQIFDAFKEYLDINLSKVSDEAYYQDFINCALPHEFFHIIGVSGDSAAFAFRAQTQFNENSKVHAVFSAFPEMCHNLLASFSGVEKKPLILAFSSSFLSPHLEIAQESFSELYTASGGSLYKPPLLGDTWEKQLLHMIVWADFASYYFAKARGVEAEPVELIDELKKKHKQKGIT